MLSTEALAAINAEIEKLRTADPDMTAEEAYASLYVPQPIMETRPKVMTIVGVLGLIGPASVQALVNFPSLESVRRAIIDQDHEAAVTWAGFLAMAGIITPTEGQLVAAHCQETEEVQVGTATPRAVSVFSGVPGMPNVLTSEEFTELWSPTTPDVFPAPPMPPPT